MTEDTFNKLSLLYQENAKVAAVFWEWRHKVLVSFFAGSTALLALAGWFYQQTELHGLIPATLFLGTLLSSVSYFLDRRNAKILRECYRIGKEIEHELIKKGGVFASIGESHHTQIAYTVTLSAVYIAVGIIFLLTSIWALKFLK